MLSFCIAHQAEIFAALFATSEVLAAIPAVKANSCFELVHAALRKLAGK